MTKILLTRHGHVEGIQPERFRGRMELPLTDVGLSQARNLAEYIASQCKPTAIYTSPMGRCIATAEFIAKATDAPFEICAGLNDLDYGAWQGHLHSEMKTVSPKLYLEWYRAPQLVRFPDGESLQDMAARTADVLRLLLHRHPDETVVVVGHDSVNRVLLTQLIDSPLAAFWRFAQTPCCVNEIDIVDGDVRIVRMNDTGHLLRSAGAAVANATAN
jgi:broad specificity phosphatase PhoE